MNIVIVGHVDHGKSTVIGRLLADTGSLPQGKLEQIREMCRRNSKPFEYAFLLDALKDERSQGITIDTARCFFKTAKRHYIILDAPGHIEFLKNMITGASRAEAALLVIDAAEGIQENSRRHGYMLSMLGIKQMAVLVNKMDLVGYDEKVYDGIVKEYTEFLNKIDVSPTAFVPVSAMEGDNITKLSPNMPWYTGGSALDVLDNFEAEPGDAENHPFRMPVQDVYKFTSDGDGRRIVAGTAVSGRLAEGEGVVFYPSGKRTTVKQIEYFDASEDSETRNYSPEGSVKREPPKAVTPGMASGFTVTEQIYVRRGELAAKEGERAPRVGTTFRASLFWLGRKPMSKTGEYLLKSGAAKVPVRLIKINSTLDTSSLGRGEKNEIDRYDVAECVLECAKPIAYDLISENAETGRFVIVDDYEISGGGIITGELTDELSVPRGIVIRRNTVWEHGAITARERAARLSQRASLLLLTGNRSTGKKETAKKLERLLFDMGRSVYFLGMGNVLYGVAGEIKTAGEVPERGEHIRRLGEVANIMLDAGMLLIVTAAELSAADRKILEMTAGGDRIRTFWLGGEVNTDIRYDMQLSDCADPAANARAIMAYLEDEGMIFKTNGSWYV